MSWQPPPRTPSAQAIYDAAEVDRANRPDRYVLESQAILDRVAARGEVVPEHFASGWRPGLDAFLRSAREEGRLNAVGIRTALASATGRLTAGAHIRKSLSECRGATEIHAPIVIVGGWRTGTTFLFRLLGSDPRLHAPLPAELVAPWRFTVPTDRPSPEMTAGGTQMLHTLNPSMAVVHPSGPHLPEECVLAMGTDMRNWGFTSMFRLPSYANWLARQDFADSYLRYREVLQLLGRHDQRRFVLKAPAHTGELEHVAATFPGSIVVQIHRDIVTTIASGASLFAVYQSTYSDTVDPVDVGRRQADQSERWFRRAEDFRSSPRRDDVTLVDVDYRDLVERPVTVVEAIYTAAGMAPPPDLEHFIADYQAKYPRDGHGIHRYSAQDFGLDAAELRDRFSFLPSR